VSPLAGGSRQAANDWNGRIDELRLFNQSLSNQTMRDIGDEPVAGVGVNDTARWMLDEGRGSTTEPYYQSSTATLAGDASWATGLEGPGLDEPGDVQISYDPFEITPQAGGDADNAPVLYVEWSSTLGATITAIGQGVQSAWALVGLFLLTAIASVAVARIREI
jgi:hypothetical protein